MSFKSFSTAQNAPSKAGSADKSKEASPVAKPAAKAPDAATPAKS